MRSIRLGLALSVLLALCGISAAVASAHSWSINGEELLEPKEVSATATIEFFQSGTIEERDSCSFRLPGTVGGFAIGKINGITGLSGEKLVKCTHISGPLCSKSFEIEALDLPWNTELVTIGGALRDQIAGHEGLVPGWSVKCKGSIGPFKDICADVTNTGITNNINGVVESIYDEQSPHGRCSGEVGEQGLVTKGVENIAVAGLTLRAM